MQPARSQASRTHSPRHRHRIRSGNFRYSPASAEFLEPRTLLAVAVSNVFAQFDGTFDATTPSHSIQITLARPNFTLKGNSANFAFHLKAAAGSALDPALVTVRDSQNHTVKPLFKAPNLASKTQSLALISLKSGTYTLTLKSDRATTGAYQLDLFLAGDANGDKKVTAADATLLKRNLNKRKNQPGYTATQDFNRDNLINAFDLSQAIANTGDSTKIRPLTLTANISPAPFTIAGDRKVSPTGNLTISGTTRKSGSVVFDYNNSEFDDASALADASGSFQLAVTLPSGFIPLRARVADTFGQTRTLLLPLTVDPSVADFQVIRQTPPDGGVDVGVTTRPQVFFSQPVEITTLTAANFFASAKGEKIPANIVPAADGTFAWLFFQQPMPDASTIQLTVDGTSILSASSQTPLDADGDGTPGGVRLTTFSTVSLTPLSGTSLSGRILEPGPDLVPNTSDDSQPGPDGHLMTEDDIYLLPVIGAKVFLLGMEDKAVFTDAQGHFKLDPVPAGDVKVDVDGRTATNASAGFYFPDMVMDEHLVVGEENLIMGAMGDMSSADSEMMMAHDVMYEPRIASAILKQVSADTGMNITADVAGAPELTPAQRAMLSIDIPPGTFVDELGQKKQSGMVGLSTVPPELVMDMLPPGVLQHTFDITVQVMDFANFAAPAPMTFPNVFGSAPGQKLNFLSFDHTTGRLVIEGSATVSADGLSVHTDPGTGITHPGWHGLTPPGTRTVGPCDPSPPTSATTDPIPRIGEVPDAEDLFPLVDHFFDGDTGEFQMIFRNIAQKPKPALDPCAPANRDAAPLIVDIKVKGPAGDFLVNVMDRNFSLAPGEERKIQVEVKKLLGNIRNIETDFLYGAQVQVKAWSPLHPQDLLYNKTLYYYRYLDASDDKYEDHTIEFPDALGDGHGGVQRRRQVIEKFPEVARPTVQVRDLNKFDYLRPFGKDPGPNWLFDPTVVQEDIAGDVDFVAPDNEKVGHMKLLGDGTPKQNLFLDREGLLDLLADIASGSPPQDIVLNAPGDAEFTLTFKGATTTDPLAPSSPGTEVQAALEKLSTIGPGNVIVSKRVYDSRVIYNVRFKGPPAGGSVPAITVGGLEAGQSAVMLAYNGEKSALITETEKQMLSDPANREAIADLVRSEVLEAYKDFPNGIELAGAPGNDTINIHWTTNGYIKGLMGISQAALLDDGIDDRQAQLALYSNRLGYSLTVLNFVASEALNQSFATNVDVYVDNILEYPILAALSLSTTQFANLLAQVLTHEATHTIGAPHTAQFENHIDEAERQKITLNQPPAAFQLTFDGRTTESIPANASAADVQAALSKLKNMLPGGVQVSGPNGGPYDIIFSGPLGPSGTPSYCDWIGADLPQMTATNATVTTIKDGKATAKIKKGKRGQDLELLLGRARGRTDIMSGGGAEPVFSAVRFRDSMSEDLLRLGLHIDWTMDEGRKTVNYIINNIGVGPFFDIPTVDLDGNYIEPPADDGGDLGSLSGPFLGILDDSGQLVPPTFNIGTVAADGPSGESLSTILHLSNPGSQNLILHSFRVLDPAGALSMDPVADATIEPGGTLTATLHFDPAAGGPFSARLLIDSNDPTAALGITLTGTGVVQGPDIAVSTSGEAIPGTIIGEISPVISEFAKVTNRGAAPLTITSIAPAAGAPFIVSALPSLPKTLAPGDSFSLDLAFKPAQIGLIPGEILISSNDSDSPTYRLKLTATGLPDSGSSLGYGGDFVAIDTPELPGSITLRARSDDNGNWSLFLPASQRFRLSIFDPESGLIANYSAISAESGQDTRIPALTFGPSTAPDTDGDGLPDDAEFAIGTSPTKPDTDGNGLSDFAEISMGLDPLGGRAFPTGVIAALSLDGSAKEITVKSSANASERVAFLATGTAGLAIVDVTTFSKPVALAQLDLPGDASDIAVDTQSNLAAVAANAGGLHIVDISNPTSPALARTIDANASHVEIVDGIAYAAIDTALRAFDMNTGALIQSLPLGPNIITGMASEGAFVYTMDTQRVLRVIDTSGFEATLRGSVTLPDAGGNLFVANSIAYAAASPSNFLGGFSTASVADPDNPAVISGSDVPGPGIRPGTAVVPNGSGLALVAGTNQGAIGVGQVVHSVDLLSIANLANTDLFVSRVTLPQVPISLAIADGIAFVADGEGDLQVANYTSFDILGIPPTITLNSAALDTNPQSPGIQAVEGKSLSLSADIIDDVQVASVELLIDGVVTRNSISAPFDLSFITPTLTAQKNSLTIQVRATDTGGNSTLTLPLTLNLLAAPAGAIVGIIPPDNAIRAQGLSAISVGFNVSLNPADVTASNFALTRDGAPVSPAAIRLRSDDRIVQLSYEPLESGFYTLSINLPAIHDRAGRVAGSVLTTSHFTLSGPQIHWINPAGGFWDDPANWDKGVLPAASDDVFIDVPGDVTITHRTGTTAVHSLISNNAFKFTGGEITTNSIQVNSNFTVDSSGGIEVTRLRNVTLLPGTGGQGITLAESAFLFLDHVTLNSTLRAGRYTTLYINNGLVLNGELRFLKDTSSGANFVDAQTLSGTGQIVFEAPEAFSGSTIAAQNGTLTIGPDITIRGNGSIGNSGAGSIISQATFIAEGAQDLAIRIFEPGIFNNQGTLSAPAGGKLFVAGFLNSPTGIISATGGGILTFFDKWNNDGVINVTDSTLNLGGRVSLPDLGTINRSGGEVILSADIDLQNQTLQLNPTTGTWNIRAATIRNGTLSATGGAQALFPAGVIGGQSGGATFDNLTLATDISINSLAIININNGLTLQNADITLAGNTSGLQFNNSQTLSGNGEVIFTGNGFETFYGNNGSVTLAPGITLRGVGNIQSVINNGTIRIDTAGKSLTVSNVANHANITAANGSSLTITNLQENTGTIAVNNSTLILDGNLTTAAIGTINRSGNVTVKYNGTIDNTNATLTIDPVNAPIQFNGTIQHGTLAITGGTFTMNQGSLTLDAVTINGNLRLASIPNVESGGFTTPNLQLQNGLTLNGTITLAAASGFAGLNFFQPQTFAGNGQVIFEDTGNNYIDVLLGPLTIGANITIRGKTGRIGRSNEPLTLLGSILADTAGGTITLLANPFTNQGTTAKSNGGTLKINGVAI